MSATQKQSDVDIALTSKRINMALDEFIKESKNEKRNNHAKNRTGRIDNRPKINVNNNSNNTKRFIGSPKVKKTLSASPMKPTNRLVSPDKIKIQIQNNKAKPLPKPISIRSKIRVNQSRTTRAPTRTTNSTRTNSSRTNSTRTNSTRTNSTRTVTNASNRAPRVVKHYEKSITLNDRFSKK
ncbi:hypothetical protein RB653_008738 [Dictyostelium firmibasis]|uniref:Uncharacterized protein n=1 Tax=Dictyostelium firmibasis TaxID=79012 RepID=A0AAN7TT80_9MYCE